MEFRPALVVRGPRSLSIGKLHKKQRPFLQGLALGNEVFYIVIAKHIFNQGTFFLRSTVEIKNYILVNVNVGKGQIESLTKSLD
jgi:hypothetical protein